MPKWVREKGPYMISVTDQPRTDDIRSPGMNPRDTVFLLQDSLVHILRMRVSIKAVYRQAERAQAAISDAERLLADLQKHGF